MFKIKDSDQKDSSSNEIKMSRWHVLKHNYEDKIEKYIYASRWILSPMYALLIVILVLIFAKFVGDLIHFISIMWTLNNREWIIQILELLDLTLVANLVLIVMFSGYENFISSIDISKNKNERLDWMGRVDFTGLKLKIISSVIAISLIELLQDFLNATSGLDSNIEFWRIVLHLTFVFTGLVFAAMEILSEKRHSTKNENKLSEMEL